MENLLFYFFEEIGNLKKNFNFNLNLDRYLFVHISLPKSENLFNLEIYENILKKKIANFADSAIDIDFEIFEDFVKENLLENEEKVFEILLKRLNIDNDFDEINDYDNKEIDSKFY